MDTTIYLEKPLVTIVTPTYKNFDYVKETIRSVLEQDYPNIEYIVSDDGSDNFPREELEQFIEKNKKNNIKEYTILHHEKNIGTVKNMNHAYRRAKGEFLMPLSGDDFFASHSTVSEIVDVFLRNSYDVLVTSRFFCEKEGKIIGFQPHILDRRKVYSFGNKELYKKVVIDESYDFFKGSTLYFRKSFFEHSNGFDERYRLLEDLPFVTEYLWDNQIGLEFDIVSICYRAEGVSNSKNHSIFRMDFGPILRSDFDIYNSTTRIRYIQELDSFTQNRLIYMAERIKLTKWSDILVIYMKHPVIMFTKIVYEMGRVFAGIYDRFYIKRNHL